MRLPEATICLVASMPSRFGMRMSRRITSGSSSSTSATACGAVFGLADDLEVRPALDDQAKPAAHERLVVGDRDADAQLASSIGSSAVTPKPPPGAAPAVRVPPRSASRSRMPIRPFPPLAVVLEADSVVADVELEAVAVADPDPHVLGGGVLETVRERFLNDPERGELDCGRERSRRALDRE